MLRRFYTGMGFLILSGIGFEVADNFFSTWVRNGLMEPNKPLQYAAGSALSAVFLYLVSRLLQERSQGRVKTYTIKETGEQLVVRDRVEFLGFEFHHWAYPLGLASVVCLLVALWHSLFG